MNDDDDLDEDMLSDEDGPEIHESDDEVIESDVEVEGEIVEADNDPPQKVIS